MGTENRFSHIPEKFERYSDRCLFIFIFLTAFIFRTYAAFTSLAPVHPDEIFQTVEMAHKTAFGKGFVFWEFNVGARSWFLPGLFAGIYKLLDFIGIKDPFYLNAWLKTILGIFHSLAVSLVYILFRKWFKDRFTAFFFTLPLAFSFMLSYLSVRTLSESASLPLLVFAVYEAEKYIENYKHRNLIFSVIFSGIAFMVRFQTASFALGLAIALFFVSKKHLKTALIFGFGYIGMILMQGMLDLFTWGKFMHSFVTYFDYNILRGVANKHGVYPWHFYIKQISENFNAVTYVSAAAFSAVVLIFFRKKPAEFLFSCPFLFFFLVHAVIAHKEPRFIFPFYFFILVASSASFAFAYEKFFKDKFFISLLFLLIILSCYTLSFTRFKDNWNTSIAWYEYWGNDKGFDKTIRGNMELSIAMGRIPDLKSAYVFGVPKLWSGGYAYFHKNVPITYTVEQKSILNSLKTIRNSDKKGVFFAFMKGHFKPFEKFRNMLIPIKGTNEFDIYEAVGSNEIVETNYSKLPKNTKNGSGWDASENVIMGKKGVKVIFSDLEKVSLLQISLDSSDSYTIVFKKGNKILGEETAPSHKNRRGMYGRSITVPEKVTKDGFDSLEIIPLEGDGAYSLGSIKILREQDLKK